MKLNETLLLVQTHYFSDVVAPGIEPGTLTTRPQRQPEYGPIHIAAII
jgi:hypothetical protein